MSADNRRCWETLVVMVRERDAARGQRSPAYTSPEQRSESDEPAPPAQMRLL